MPPIRHDHVMYGPPTITGPEHAMENVTNAVALAALRTVITRKLHTDVLRVCRGNPFLKVTKPNNGRE